jgi:hypothetical protein
LASTEAEPYVGPLAAPPYRYDDANAVPSPVGDACMYRGHDGRSVVVTVSPTRSTVANLPSGPPGPWDRSWWSPVGTLVVWKHDVQIMVDVSGTRAGQPGAIDLATKIIGRLDHPLDYDGTHAAALAPKP